MEVFDVIRERRSIRRYREEKINEETLRKIMEAARLAPSSSNIQSWKFIIVTSKELRRKLKDAARGQKFVEEAPVVIACCIDLEAFKEQSKQTIKLLLKGALRPSLEMILRTLGVGGNSNLDAERQMVNATINVSIASEHIVLAARNLGLGTCWIRAFEEEKVEEILALPEHLKVLALLTLGYPQESPSPRPRKTLEEITIWRTE
ncbi:MAG: nitroreductase family protein [Actinomycetota bacterium]|nr:nitroreductase family protein [Actinomycetota bacterium]